ncbi:unnamed protein product [Prorocentrum cordatum]|uniref:Uncharacterized protein n=1 Tax=Prorocentrum cordatum TaxID=2364126 RepID=A0ABN9YCM2_9DINO|nr:unnamed protein product [Polarella glacialis]
MECLRCMRELNFYINGPTFERRETAKAARSIQAGSMDLLVRDFAPLVLARGDVEAPCYDRLERLFTVELMWTCVPEDCYSVEFRAVAFQTLSRLGCAVEYVWRAERRGFPWILFRVLERPETKEAVSKMSKYLMDQISLQIISDHPDLQGDVCDAKIFSFMLKWACDNGPQERAFARIRRTVGSKSNHLPQVSFQDMSNDWVFNQARTRVSRQQFVDELKPCTPDKLETGDQVRSRSKGSGGPWRAFCRQKLLESNGKADFAAWSVEYYNLPPDEKARLKAIGEAATSVARSGSSDFCSSFGPTRSDAMKLTKRAKISHHAMRDIELNPTDMVLRNRGENIPSLDEALISCRAVVRARREQDQKQLHEDIKAILHAPRTACPTQRGGKGKCQVDQMERCLGGFSGSFVAVPASGKLRVLEPNFDMCDDVGRALAWASPRYKSSGLCSALEAFNDWARDFITHAAGPKEQPGLRHAEYLKCCAAEMCVCTGAGRDLSNRIARFLTFLRLVTRPGSTERSMVNDGRLVVKLTGRDLGDADDDIPHAEVWYHIGLMYWSPYLPTFMEVEPVRSLNELPPRPDRVYIKSLLKFKSCFAALKCLMECPRWSVSAYIVEYSRRAIVSIAPHTVPVVPLRGFPAYDMWPRPGGRAAASAAEAPEGPCETVGEDVVDDRGDDQEGGGEGGHVGGDIDHADIHEGELEDLIDAVDEAREGDAPSFGGMRGAQPDAPLDFGAAMPAGARAGSMPRGSRSRSPPRAHGRSDGASQRQQLAQLAREMDTDGEGGH